jgi:hypothetical protein
MGVEKGEELLTKGTDNLFKRIIGENFPHLENGREAPRSRKSTEHQTIRPENETLSDTS